MKRIHVLEESVAARIAAGEVVASPAAAVKELAENSLDAGADSITVEIVEGGKELIRVTDNGSGIHEEDMELAVAKHATSKIAVASDLAAVSTLGFRGEALFSLAACSRLTISSRPADSLSGCVLRVNGGGRPNLSFAGLPEGTTVRAESLFYNIPARRKFLKSTAQEAAKVGGVITKMILGNPAVSFKYINNGKIVYQSPGSGKLTDALATVYGSEITQNIVEVNCVHENISVTGLVSQPSFLHKSANNIYFFLNGRPIQSNALKDALLAGYGERILHSHFPLCALTLVMPYEYADVNVHPGKLQVLFYHENDVKDAVKTAVAGALAQSSPPSLGIKAETSYPDSADDRPLEEDTAQHAAGNLPRLNTADRLYRPVRAVGESAGYLMDAMIYPTNIFENTLDAIIEQDIVNNEAEQTELKDVRDLCDFTVIGQVFETYILCECGQALYLIDQHAAHERLNYERMKAALEEGKGTAQQLLLPVVKKFLSHEFSVLGQNESTLLAMGFELEEFGPLCYKFTALPVAVDSAGVHKLIDEIIHELSQDKNDIVLNRDRVIRAACRYSIKAGDRLSDGEIKELMAEIAGMEAIPTCPHGRPVAIAITKTELEKGFKRTV
ncbi:MAG TPA: DNA mismatch repair endonuclease MutL [Clostridiales bacterium]|nr:DNA mismatch repair endonuclease MutL [Clostridiales bacterium]